MTDPTVPPIVADRLHRWGSGGHTPSGASLPRRVGASDWTFAGGRCSYTSDHPGGVRRLHADRLGRPPIAIFASTRVIAARCPWW